MEGIKRKSGYEKATAGHKKQEATTKNMWWTHKTGHFLRV